MTLGERIEKLRQDKHLSQKELATTLGKKTTDIALWESDEATPSITDLSKLSSVLGVTIDSLINDVEISEDSSESNFNAPAEDTNNTSDIQSQEIKTKSKKKTVLIISLIAAIILIITGIIVVLFALNPSKTFSEDTNAIEKAASSVVKIYCYDYEGNETGTGSGFIAYDNQTVITNYHVMAEAYSCKISTDQDKTLEIESIINYSEDNDIAILRLKDSSGLDVLEFGNSDTIKKGETVTAIGSPLGIKNTVSKGVLSGRVMEKNMDVLQFTAEISHGSSGGALFNEQGEVIGITYASYVDGQNLNIAIPIELVDKLQEKKILERKPEAIYMFEHPYATYLIENKDSIEDVTFDELKTNPAIWNNKIIRITAYASSLNDNGALVYIADSQINASNNSQIDLQLNLNSDFEQTDIISTAGYELYSDDINVGDKVCVIGEFNYMEKGETDNMFPNHPRVLEHNEGEIVTKILFNVTN